MRTYKSYLDAGGEDAAKKVHALREFYRREFRNGNSDECFILWLESAMERARELEQEGENHD